MPDHADALLEAGAAPTGGTPFDCVRPGLMESAVRRAIELKRAEISAITSNPAPPTFENAIEVIEDSRRALKREDVLRAVAAQTPSLGCGQMSW